MQATIIGAQESITQVQTTIPLMHLTPWNNQLQAYSARTHAGLSAQNVYLMMMAVSAKTVR